MKIFFILLTRPDTRALLLCKLPIVEHYGEDGNKLKCEMYSERLEALTMANECYDKVAFNKLKYCTQILPER